MLKNAFGFTTPVDIFYWPEQAEQMSSLLGKKLIVIFMFCRNEPNLSRRLLSAAWPGKICTVLDQNNVLLCFYSSKK